MRAVILRGEGVHPARKHSVFINRKRVVGHIRQQPHVLNSTIVAKLLPNRSGQNPRTARLQALERPVRAQRIIGISGHFARIGGTSAYPFKLGINISEMTRSQCSFSSKDTTELLRGGAGRHDFVQYTCPEKCSKNQGIAKKCILPNVM